ncbi:hypothetical protein [Dyadobacter sp. LHD-138]|uniref:hypothetical protein n=1 Tax=Dyadobacter sp. LHD-138 TaxID=3071413 RepID=UPI0027E14338|nr:hypothetical protein [Dyadobacter sp. LHD-138]MDQ6479804.1 hypothetical protein [Dyadobacter sp. LHD-138]
MMNSKIQQQESAVEMIRQLVNAKRSRPERLEAAINELNRLKSDLVVDGAETAPGDTAAPRMSRKVTAIMKDVNSDIFALKHSALSQEADRLRRDQAELSNMLVKVPPGQPCPDLVNKILELHYKIEAIWDEKKFLDRNQFDGPKNPAHDQQVIERPVQAVVSKAELSVKLQKCREKRSKLKSKLLNPKASMAARSKWELELVQIEAAIEETEGKRALM